LELSFVSMTKSHLGWKFLFPPDIYTHLTKGSQESSNSVLNNDIIWKGRYEVLLCLNASSATNGIIAQGTYGSSKVEFSTLCRLISLTHAMGQPMERHEAHNHEVTWVKQHNFQC
jgi:hypothetical protein